MDTVTNIMHSVHMNSVNHGFYEGVETILAKMTNSGFSDEEIAYVKDAFVAQKLMLTVSELSEALEANRKGNRAVLAGCDPNTHDFKESFELSVKDSFEDELADTCIRLFDLAEWQGVDLEEHIKLKHLYNKQRPYKHGKKY